MFSYRSASTAENFPAASTEEENIREQDVQRIKNELLSMLKSYESVIFYFQQLFVWEKPLHSVVFVLMLHAGFWYLKVWSSHSLGLIAFVILLAVWLDTWKHKIWPEIRAVDPDPEADDWGELHPRLLSLPEICLVLAELAVNARMCFRAVRKCKNETPGKFAAFTTVSCLLTIILGRAIPGTLIAYIIMLCCLIWPLFWYRRWMERAYSQMEPFLMQLQYSLKPRLKRNSKGKKHPRITEIDGASIEVHTDSSEDDEDLSEFLKPLDAKTAEVLARALTDDSELSESDESLLAHELPSFSRPSSLDGDRGSHTLAEVALPSRVPAFEDPDFAKEVLDESDDENLGLPNWNGVDSQNQDSGYSNEARQVTPSDTCSATRHTQGLAHQMIANATAEAMTAAVKNVFTGSMQRLKQWSPTPHVEKVEDRSGESGSLSRQSTPSDDGFVVLDARDLSE